jgi:endoglucanase
LATAKEFLFSLCNSTGVSGFEFMQTADLVTEAFNKFCDEVYSDTLGNVIGVKKGTGAGKILLAAHMDEIGLMVSGYEEGGFLRFTTIGGYDYRSLVAQEVIVHAKDGGVYGVIGVKPPHITTAAEAKKAHKVEDMAIDTGLCDCELKEKVRIGDIITVKREMVELKGGHIAGKALDDRAGVAVLYQIMQDLKGVEIDNTVYFVASVQEEVGCKGALCATYDIRPDIAIALDVTHGISPDVAEPKGNKLGDGPVIDRGPNIHPKVFSSLKQCAADNFIAHQIAVSPGMSGTDAWMMQVAGPGSATGVISFPLKYMHTSVEVMMFKDIQLTAKLLTSYVLGLNGEDLEVVLCY